MLVRRVKTKLDYNTVKQAFEAKSGIRNQEENSETDICRKKGEQS